MYTDFYKKASDSWRKRAGGAELLTKIDLALRLIVALGYIALLVLLVVTHDSHLVRAIVVPLLCYLFVTIMRAIINAPRPYTSYDIDPLINKDTPGHSMPSRHMASAIIIALTVFWSIGPVWGSIALIICLAIAYVRIVGGVHYPRDIVVGAIIAALFALVGFVLIP